MIVSIGAGLGMADEPRRAVRVDANRPYKSGDQLTEYERERCVLDVHRPSEPGKQLLPILVWFHGGGLKHGDKDGRDNPQDNVKTALIAQSLAAEDVIVAAPNYRLSPRVHHPEYVHDAAAATAWAVAQAESLGGDRRRVFIGGHSAGAYLALMVALDSQHLARHGVEASSLAGVAAVSGQVMTHYTVREERGIAKHSITADAAAPIFFARKSTVPLLVVWGDRDMPTRGEENAFFVSVLKDVGNPQVRGISVPDRDHGSIAGAITQPNDPTRAAILQMMKSGRLN